jgi:hypothetical protein
MVLYIQIEWSLVSCMELVKRDHGYQCCIDSGPWSHVWNW